MSGRGLRQGRSTTTKTVAENEWFTKITQAGCVCCDYLGHTHDPDGYRVEQHHLTSGGIRIGHMASVGLCIWHHRRRILIATWSLAEHIRRLGYSLECGSGLFQRQFGDDDWLMQRQLMMLGME